MCGITGKIFFSKERNVSLNELKKMTDILQHRGPDDEGFYINKNVGLGFRRLSIIDLKSGHQPLSDNSERFWITFNGEIYNFQELRTSLQKKGYFFRTNSDTEVIVNLYAEYKENCLDYLRGMFAFVIWDKKEQVLFGARDRFGIKPFYYYIDNEKFVWASELKSILASKDIDKDIRIESLDYYFAYGYTPRDQSIYNKIKKLKPGHYFLFKVFERDKLSIKPYWEINFDPDYSKTEDYWKEAIFETLNESVKMRMISDVPLGAFLSGGIDSSTVVALMSLNSKRPVKTFSIGFKDKIFNELQYARQIAERYHTEHHEYIVEPESIDLIPKLVRAFDEPFADASAISTYYVSKLTREHVTVALSGDGGDEFFVGYNSYSKFFNLYNKRYSAPVLFAIINKMIPDYMYGKGISYYLSKDKNKIAAYGCFWKNYERRKIFHTDINKKLENDLAEKIKIDLLNSMDGNFISNMQKLDIQTYMVDDILTKVDRTSMLNSLEVRVPFLDHKFAELSFKIPSEFKMKGDVKKYILKESFKHLLPPDVITHKKRGFGVPLSKWFRGDLKNYSYDVLMDNNHLNNFLDKKQIKKILDNQNKGVRDFSSKIWSLIVLNEWLKQNDN